MNAKKWKTIAIAEAVLLIACMAFWGVPKMLDILGDHGKAVLAPFQMEMNWRTCPNDEMADPGQPLRVAGKVTTLVGANEENGGHGGYLMACNGASIPVEAFQGGLETDSLPTMNTVVFVLGRYIGSNAVDPNAYIEEILRFPLDGSMGVTEEEWNGWLEFGYEFAVENAFRRLVVIANNGKRMDALSEIDWMQLQKEGGDLLVSDKDAIRRFLSENQTRTMSSWW